jgi:hypothetical protein
LPESEDVVRARGSPLQWSSVSPPSTIWNRPLWNTRGFVVVEKEAEEVADDKDVDEILLAIDMSMVEIVSVAERSE